MPMLAISPRLFTVDEYHAMGEAGIFQEDNRVELIDGQILAMSPIGSPHVHCINALTRAFAERLYGRGEPPRAVVSVQNPVRLNNRTEPQPDVVLLRADMDKQRLPRPEDVFLIVEVSDTTLEFDMEIKAPRYAAAGIPEVWVVDLQEECIHVYRKPGPGGYAKLDRRGAGEEIGVERLPGLGTFGVDEIIG
jgi:Uma2 family endonuclease